MNKRITLINDGSPSNDFIFFKTLDYSIYNTIKFLMPVDIKNLAIEISDKKGNQEILSIKVINETDKFYACSVESDHFKFPDNKSIAWVEKQLIKDFDKRNVIYIIIYQD